MPPIAASALPPPRTPGRTRLWELTAHLHCSVIGTCLSSGELRAVLIAVGLPVEGRSDHELHTRAVALAGGHTAAGKRLHGALDKRHARTIARFAEASAEHEVRALWKAGLRCGEIAGSYWATLTHPATTPVLISEAFGEVHMLSHLQGQTSAADIRRVATLEADCTRLRHELEARETVLSRLAAERDARVRELERELNACRSAAVPAAPSATPAAAVLERRLSREAGRRDEAERRLEAASLSLAEEQRLRIAAETRAEALQAEMAACESVIASLAPDTAAPFVQPAWRTVLYVGGRHGQVAALRAAAARIGVEVLHHDGGVEASTDRLGGLVSRADLVVFPIECVSHEATAIIKRACQRLDKAYRPLRSMGIGALLSALTAPEAAAPR
jgi:hypothetical protein